MTAAVLILGALLAPRASAQSPPLTVRIDRPRAGVEDAWGQVAELLAEVSDPTVLTATLTIHGASYEVPVSGGRISQRIVVAPGPNRVGVTVRRGDELATDSVSWTARGEAAELLVLASWQARGEIIDLWVREPGGETCKWDHRTTASGGRLLDFSADAIGFGSQGYTTARVEPGTYRIKLHYWGAAADEDARWSGDLESMLAELDAAERLLARGPDPRQAAERDRLLARLDRWALPAAPQVLVRVEAILFPGTRAERRWRFDRLVRRSGDLATLGEIEIDEALVRAARAELAAGASR